jgi:hypothetical protein
MSIIIKYCFNTSRLSKLTYQPSQDQSYAVDNTVSSQTKPPLPSNHQRSNAAPTNISNISSTTTKSSHRRNS